jgi:hypothetical protein
MAIMSGLGAGGYAVVIGIGLEVMFVIVASGTP